jgi:hypothetical protein
MPEPPLDPDLAALSAALGGLAPAAPALARDRLLYEAGRRAGRRPPLAACCFALLAAALGLRLATTPGPAPPIERIVYVPVPAAPPVADGSGSSGSALASREWELPPRPAGAVYLQMRDQVLRFGADSLPAAAGAAPAPPPTVERLLGLPSGSLNDDQKARWKTQLFRGDV